MIKWNLQDAVRCQMLKLRQLEVALGLDLWCLKSNWFMVIGA